MVPLDQSDIEAASLAMSARVFFSVSSSQEELTPSSGRSQ